MHRSNDVFSELNIKVTLKSLTSWTKKQLVLTAKCYFFWHHQIKQAILLIKKKRKLKSNKTV